MTPAGIAIAGLGLIGASIGSAVRNTGVRVTGYDPSQRACEAAISLGHVDDASTDLRAGLQKAELVILAAPVPEIVRLIGPVARVLPRAVILDVGSVKTPVVNEMVRMPMPGRSIGGHPIAGKETSGAAHADAALFRGRPFVLTPHPFTDENALNVASWLIDTVGGRAIVTSAAEHDRVVARTSHLPQVLSTVLAGHLQPGDARFSGQGLLDMSRLALSDPDLWTGILAANSRNVTDELRHVAAQLESLAGSLERDHMDDVRTLLHAAREEAMHLRERVAA